MKRDFELIKSILVEIEEHPKANDWKTIEISTYSDEEISYHIKLLHLEGLIEAKDLSTKSGFRWVAITLTWKGHDFLDNAKNETVWKKTVQLVKEKGGSISFNIFQNLLQTQATKLFE